MELTWRIAEITSESDNIENGGIWIQLIRRLRFIFVSADPEIFPSIYEKYFKLHYYCLHKVFQTEGFVESTNNSL